jgi:Ca-activated chloride channel family protein
MKDKIDGKTKFDMARDILSKATDSISKIAGKIEIGIRVFGHQSPRPEHNCTDSKLEVPFGRNNSKAISEKLASLVPQGWTPLAYSLQQAASDFPPDLNALNAIILISDGLESCNGDPCAMAKLFEEKRISLKPYIVGLGVNEEDADRYSCIGKYYDAKDEKGLKNALSIIITQVMGNTTVQVNLLDSSLQPNETDVPITFSDFYSGEVLNKYVHALNAGMPDTFYLDPIGKYNVMVHTLPSVQVSEVEIIPGVHNLIAVDVPQGWLKISNESKNTANVIVRQSGKNEIINVQDLNSEVKYLIGSYDLEILTLPPIIEKDVLVPPNGIKEVIVPQNGTVNFTASEPHNYSIFDNLDALSPRMIWEEKRMYPKQAIEMQPGNYKVVYRKVKNAFTIETKTKKFVVESGKIVQVVLE